MTGLALRNPIAVLMLCIGLIVFSGVVTQRMSVDTFPELSPPVLVIGTLAPGLGPKDVEKAISWRLEKYVSSTPGVDHVESACRERVATRIRAPLPDERAQEQNRRWVARHDAVGGSHAVHARHDQIHRH